MNNNGRRKDMSVSRMRVSRLPVITMFRPRQVGNKAHLKLTSRTFPLARFSSLAQGTPLAQEASYTLFRTTIAASSSIKQTIITQSVHHNGVETRIQALGACTNLAHCSSRDGNSSRERPNSCSRTGACVQECHKDRGGTIEGATYQDLQHLQMESR